MKFDQGRPIFEQIVDLMCQRILSDQWQAQQRLPSVRQFAAELEVNPNTCMRAYGQLQQQGVIFNKRGVGYFVEEGAKASLLQHSRHAFLTQTLPEVLKRARLLGVTEQELLGCFHQSDG